MANATMFTVMPISELCELIKRSVAECFDNELKSFLKTSIQEEEKLLNIQEACQLLKVSKVTIHKWKKNQTLPFHRMGRKIYFKRSELINSLKFINDKKKQNG